MDYLEVIRALKTKADRTEFAGEREVLLAKVQELEGKYRGLDREVKQTVVEFAKGDKLFREMMGFPVDWYDTMDEWWDIDIGSGAELGEGLARPGHWTG